jgi:prepilin signal peptidase PulO-like enzyme (type II secretory pathway)
MNQQPEMTVGVVIAAGVVGVVAGALVSWLATTLPAGVRVRLAVCRGCERPLLWWEWLGLARAATPRRLHGCDCGAGAREVAVETCLCAWFAMLVAWRGVSWQVVVVAIFSAILVLVVVTDLEHRRILDAVTYPGAVLAMVSNTLLAPQTWWQWLAGAAVGYGIFWMAGVVGRRLFGQGALGGGDVKLAGMIGAMVGVLGIWQALVFGSLAACVYCGVALVTKRVGRGERFPFGPFMVLGTVISLMWRLAGG